MENDTNAPNAGNKDGLAGGERGHTPGPWKITGPDNFHAYFRVRGTALGKKYRIANCPYYDCYDRTEAESNARLIALAPEMLEALREAEAALEAAVAVIAKYAKKADWPGSSPRKGLEIVRAALTKVEPANAPAQHSPKHD